jgi:hypothetical protein
MLHLRHPPRQTTRLTNRPHLIVDPHSMVTGKMVATKIKGEATQLAH